MSAPFERRRFLACLAGGMVAASSLPAHGVLPTAADAEFLADMKRRFEALPPESQDLVFAIMSIDLGREDELARVPAEIVHKARIVVAAWRAGELR